MSIYLGDTKISGSSVVLIPSFPLFTSVWQDHILNNASWLRSDTFSWQNGSVYTSAYQHLVDDINGITSETETIGVTTITFYRADDGHKIVEADQESNVEAIYTATGVAWYYILDTDNTRFKLPRTKWDFVGYRDSVGKYVAESLPNITGKLAVFGNSGTWGLVSDNASSNFNQQGGAFQTDSAGYTQAVQTGKSENSENVKFDASYSSSAYQNDAPVQQRATQMYLYFYVGNTVQGQTEIDVGQITEDLNGKADLDLANLNNAGKIVSAKMSMPSNTYEALTLLSSGSTYTAPSDGWFVANATSSSAVQHSIRLYNSTNKMGSTAFDYAGWKQYANIEVKKGDIVTYEYQVASGSFSSNDIYFVYAEGSKSEAA